MIVTGAGYIGGSLSNGGTSTSAAADTVYTFAKPVNHVWIQNNCGAALGIEVDANTVATAGSPQIGGSPNNFFFDVQGLAAVHLLTTLAQPVNGNSANNIVIRAWL